MHWWYRVMNLLSVVHVLDCWRHISVTGIQITCNTIICSMACSGYQQRKHQRSALMNHCHWPRLLVHSLLFEHFNPIRNMDLLQLCLVVLPQIYSWWRHQMETFSALLAICAGIHRSPVNSPHKGQRRGALRFSLICVWINGWVNNREAGDLRRYRAHYDVTVMFKELVNLMLLLGYMWRPLETYGFYKVFAYHNAIMFLQTIVMTSSRSCRPLSWRHVLADHGHGVIMFLQAIIAEDDTNKDKKLSFEEFKAGYYRECGK